MKKNSFFVFHLISFLVLSLSLGSTSWAVVATVRGAASDNLQMGVVGDFDGDGDQNLIVCSGNVDLKAVDVCVFSAETIAGGVIEDPYDVPNEEVYDPYDPDCDGYTNAGAAGYYSNPFTGDRDFVYSYDDTYDPKIPADVVIHGNEDDDYFAQTCANVGDVTGDGLEDLAFGTYSLGTGFVHLVPGNSSFSSGFTDINTMMDAGEAYEYAGESNNSLAGRSIAPAGDFNGDGIDDFVVGAYYDDEGGSNAGAVYVVLGSATPSGGDLASEIKYIGKASNDYAGRSVSGGYDINADGFDDVVVGAFGDDDGGTSAGAAYIIFGSASPTGGSLASEIKYTGEASSDYAGWAVANLGDTNADGFADILVGAYGNDDKGSSAGAAYLILGSASPAGGSLSAADVEFKGKAAGDYAGYSVAAVGDTNADGRNDFLIGAYGNDDAASNAGAAYLIKGMSTYFAAQMGLPVVVAAGNYFLGVATSNENFGSYVGSAGDFDGDGRNDIIIGAYGNDEGGGSAGKVWVITAPMTAPRGASVR